MKSVPGPHTEEALKYYLDVASAANDALAQKDHLSKFQTVVRRRPKPVIEAPEPKPAVPAERLSVKEGAQARTAQGRSGRQSGDRRSPGRS